MARKTTKKTARTRRVSRSAGKTGSLRVRSNVSARRATNTDTPQAREVRERIDAAVEAGARLRQDIMQRIEDGLREPARVMVPRLRR